MNNLHFLKLEWQSMYWDNDGLWYRYLDWQEEEPSPDEVPRYEIVFDFDGIRFYCFVDARNVDEALGIFFRHHQTVTYYHIVDHLEI